MDAGTVDDLLDTVDRRSDYLEFLSDGPASKKEIIDGLDTSRSTADRAIRTLEELDLVERTSEGYRTTATGRIALERHREYRRTAGDVAGAAGVLNALPPDTDVDVAMISGSEVVGADYATPYRPGERLQDRVSTAGRYRAVLPTIEDPRHVRLLYECVVTDGNPADLVVSRELLDTLRSKFPRRLAAMADTDRFTLSVGETPPYGVVRTDREGETAATVLVFSEDGTLTGLLENESPDAVDWADDRIDALRADAEAVTDLVGDSAERSSGTGARTRLESEGFLRLSRGFFADRPTADPVSAWRAGLDLSEVQAGYAAERTREVDGERQSLTEELADRLGDGDDVALVGPPGSGKSTVCKRVAVEWYREGKPVYYRESGRGRPFESVEDLVEVVRGDEGHTLVVVEDAARPGANGIFEAAARLDDDASVLVDARESEWSAADGSPGGRPAPANVNRFEVVTMPGLLGGDADDLVEQFESTVGVDVPGDKLRERIRSDLGETPASEAFLLTHRLALHAGSGDGETPTTLVEDVAAAYESVAGCGEAVLDGAVLVNALNAADLAVEADRIRAVADDATEAVVDSLRGRAIFDPVGPDDRFRTVHGGWSVAFLDHLRREEGAADARDRLSQCLDAVVESVSPDVRPDVVESVFETAVEWPKLAPVFDVEPPEFLDRPTTLSCLAARGEMRFEAGDFETARERYRTLCDRTPDPTGEDDPPAEGRFLVQGKIGLAKVADRANDVQRGRQYARAALAAARSLDDRRYEVASHLHLGALAYSAGDFETAIERQTTAIEMAESVGDRRRAAEAYVGRGTSHLAAGDLGPAKPDLTEGRDLAREVGDRMTGAKATNALGLLARRRGELGAAARHNRQALAFARERGKRTGVLASLINLGGIETDRGDPETALEYQQEALELAREMDHDSREGQILAGISLSHRLLGDPGAAIDAAERALSILDPEGETDYYAEALTKLAHAHLDANDPRRARALANEALEICADFEFTSEELDAMRIRGRVALAEDDYETAREYLERGLEMSERHDERTHVARFDVSMGELALARDDPELASERFEAALETARETGAAGIALEALDGLVDACEDLGDHRRARKRCDEAISMADSERLIDRRKEFEDRKASLAPDQ